jgi:hypothetical protein
VLGRPPLEIGALNLDETDVMRGLAPILDYVPFTGVQNVTGQPAISLPLAWSKSGLPIGVQFASAKSTCCFSMRPKSRGLSRGARSDRRFTANEERS